MLAHLMEAVPAKLNQNGGYTTDTRGYHHDDGQRQTDRFTSPTIKNCDCSQRKSKALDYIKSPNILIRVPKRGNLKHPPIPIPTVPGTIYRTKSTVLAHKSQEALAGMSDNEANFSSHVPY